MPERRSESIASSTVILIRMQMTSKLKWMLIWRIFSIHLAHFPTRRVITCNSDLLRIPKCVKCNCIFCYSHRFSRCDAIALTATRGFLFSKCLFVICSLKFSWSAIKYEIYYLLFALSLCVESMFGGCDTWTIHTVPMKSGGVFEIEAECRVNTMLLRNQLPRICVLLPLLLLLLVVVLY